MKIIPLEQNYLKIEHHVEKEVRLTKAIGFDSKYANKCIRRCTMCNKIEKTAEWYEVDDREVEADLSENNFVIYTVCPTCKN